MKYYFKLSLLSGVLLSAQACNAESDVIVDIGKPSIVEAHTLSKEAIRFDGKLTGAWSIRDRDGEHILVLTRKAGPSPQEPQSGRVEKIDLTATYYKRQDKQWQQEWIIRDGSDCPGLDVAGDFYADEVSFTDLNNDGQAEVTVPYHLFCGGGIDSRTVKVILREGTTKLAIRGESLVVYPGQKPFGGAHRHDKTLLTPERVAYKRHMDAIWQKVSMDVRK